MNYLNELIKTVEILRSPEGCEWDRQQTHQTIRQNMLEEAYEAVEAIDENNFLKPGLVLFRIFIKSMSINHYSEQQEETKEDMEFVGYFRKDYLNFCLSFPCFLE